MVITLDSYCLTDAHEAHAVVLLNLPDGLCLHRDSGQYDCHLNGEYIRQKCDKRDEERVFRPLLRVVVG